MVSGVCRPSLVALELVADAPDRLDVARVERIRLDLLAQTTHMHRDRAGVATIGVAPHLVEQLRAREDRPRVAGQEEQQIELFGCERERRVVVRDAARAGVNREAVVPSGFRWVLLRYLKVIRLGRSAASVLPLL